MFELFDPYVIENCPKCSTVNFARFWKNAETYDKFLPLPSLSYLEYMNPEQKIIEHIFETFRAEDREFSLGNYIVLTKERLASLEAKIQNEFKVGFYLVKYFSFFFNFFL